MRFKHQEKFIGEFERARSVRDCVRVLCRSVHADAEVQASLFDRPTDELRRMLRDACVVCPDERLRALSRSQLLSILSTLISDEIQGHVDLILALLCEDDDEGPDRRPHERFSDGPSNRLPDQFRDDRRSPDLN